MTKLNLKAFKELVSRSRSKTTFFANTAKDSLLTAARSWVVILERHDVDESPMDFNSVKEDEGFTSDDLSLVVEENSEKNSTVVVNWLIKLVDKLWVKVAEQAEMIKINFNRAEAKEGEVAKLKEEVVELRKYCDEVQQRSMKGNLIISSLTTQQKKSLLNLEAGVLNGDHVREDATALCIRLIKLKTGIEVPPSDISACHMLKKQGNESPFIIRFHNMKPGSAWERLTAGLMTGKADGRSFSDANVYINYQVTQSRGELLKHCRQARKDGSIRKYSTDQNGNISVQIDQRGAWTRVSSPSGLRQFISNNRQPRAAAGAQDRRHR